jgi:type II secretory pathway component PulL
MVNALYVLVNVIPLPFWFLMIFLPNRDITRRVASTYTVFLVLGILYVLTLIGAAIALLTAPRSAPPDFTTSEGPAALFANPVGALAAWLHMLTMDLLAGHWIYHEAQRLQAPRLLASVALVLAYMFGPLGVFVFVLWRTLRAQRAEPSHRQQEQPA